MKPTDERISELERGVAKLLRSDNAPGDEEIIRQVEQLWVTLIFVASGLFLIATCVLIYMVRNA